MAPSKTEQFCIWRRGHFGLGMARFWANERQARTRFREESKVFGGALRWLVWGAGALMLLRMTAAETVGGAGDVSFSRDILPVLSDNCFHCHGPAESGRKAGLRLDTREGALRVRDGRAVVDPGNLESSELIARILSEDPDDVMPPPDSHRALDARQKELIKEWVRQGAPWGRHWAFEPIVKPSVPEKAGEGWARNEIDRFIARGHEREGLPPAPEAAPDQWITRLSLDLTGLPPTPADLERFGGTEGWKAGAYEAWVDRLLASDAYGERMAIEWLDLARYADTFGYQSDVDMRMSPWRDWVIGAINANLPYDDFIRWQVAGDLLPEATAEQRLATGFNRLHRQTNEGGSIEEEWRSEYVSDRVHTLGTAVLGLTLECARCHDHKYDPISQKDYYSLYGLFNSIDESGLYSHFTGAVPTPTMFLYGLGDDARHEELKRTVKRAEAELEAARARADREGVRTIEDDEWKVRPVAAYDFGLKTDGKILCQVTGNTADGVSETESGRRGTAMVFNGDDAITCRGAGKYGRTDAFTIGAWIKPTQAQDRAVIWHYSRAWSDSGSRGYELLLDKGRPSWALIHFWPGNAIAVRALDPLPEGEWSHVVVSHDGSGRADGLKIHVNGRLVEKEMIRDNLYKDIHHLGAWGDGDAGGLQLTLGARFRDHGFKGGRLEGLKVFDVALTGAEVRGWVAAETDGEEKGVESPSEDDVRGEVWVARADPAVRDALGKLKAARDAENGFVTGLREIMVMGEMRSQRPTFVLDRGAYDAPGERVEPGAPESIFPWRPEWPRNRLGLSQWLLDEENPLTARVVVNRVWKHHFGQGLVATVEDFGMQSRSPVHPELLDWLAAWFMENGWDRKALHRLIVTSASYRQNSAGNPMSMIKDPENRWLARGPAHRLPAEVIRDRALAAGGLLVTTVGGPSVKPYQPAGVWEEAGTGKVYHQDKGEKLYRKSLYTFLRRTAPPPSMLTFDATSREVCTAKREPTATPLQALVLLNDPQYIEAARSLAESAMRAHPSDVPNRIRKVFVQLVGRWPEGREESILAQLWAEQLGYFREDPTRATAYLGVGERPVDATLPAVDLAATAVIANLVMNMDDFVMKR